MKILFFIDCLGSGGKERRLTELIKALTKDSFYQITLVLMSRDVHYKEIFEQGIDIHYIIRKTKKDITVFRIFRSLCAQVEPDIIHCWDSMTAVYSLYAAYSLNIKLVNGMVTDTPVVRNVRNKHWFRARITFPFSDRIVGNSNAGLKAYRAPQKISVCIYNGMNLLRFENLGDKKLILSKLFGNSNNEFFIAGMVAMFHDRKDYETLIEGALNLTKRYSNIRFILIGSGINLQETIKKVPYELKEKILFLGNISEVEKYVSIFDVGILLTNSNVHGEGISNSVIEYMALAKPVIATRGGGTDEVVIDQVNGYLIDPGDRVALEEKIITLMEHKELGKNMGDQGLKNIKAKFDVQIMTNEYKKLYKGLTAAIVNTYGKGLLKNVRVLNFHTIKDVKSFEKVLKSITSNCNLVSAEELIQDHQVKNSKSYCHLTFDDGHISFYTMIYPLLKKFGVPATLFVSPKVIMEEKNYWFQEIEQFDYNKLRILISSKYGLNMKSFKRVSVFWILKLFKFIEIQEIIEEYKSYYGQTKSTFMNITIDQLRELDKDDLITIGAHTMEHPVLANEDLETVEYEISSSFRLLEEIIGHEVNFFAYPNGYPEIDYGMREIALLKRNNCKIAFTTEPKRINGNVDLYQYPRFCFEDSHPLYFFIKFKLAEKWFQIRNLIFRDEKLTRAQLKNKLK